MARRTAEHEVRLLAESLHAVGRDGDSIGHFDTHLHPHDREGRFARSFRAQAHYDSTPQQRASAISGMNEHEISGLMTDVRDLPGTTPPGQDPNRKPKKGEDLGGKESVIAELLVARAKARERGASHAPVLMTDEAHSERMQRVESGRARPGDHEAIRKYLNQPGRREETTSIPADAKAYHAKAAKGMQYAIGGTDAKPNQHWYSNDLNELRAESAETHMVNREAVGHPAFHVDDLRTGERHVNHFPDPYRFDPPRNRPKPEPWEVGSVKLEDQIGSPGMSFRYVAQHKTTGEQQGWHESRAKAERHVRALNGGGRV